MSIYFLKIIDFSQLEVRILAILFAKKGKGEKRKKKKKKKIKKRGCLNTN